MSDLNPDGSLGDGWFPCPCCGGAGGSNAGPLPRHEAAGEALSQREPGPCISDCGAAVADEYAALASSEPTP